MFCHSVLADPVVACARGEDYGLSQPRITLDLSRSRRWRQHTCCGINVERSVGEGSSLSAGIGGKKLHEFSGLSKGMLGVADGNPLLFDAQIVSVGELETS